MRIPLLRLTVLMVAALGLVACGDETSSGPPPPTSGPTGGPDSSSPPPPTSGPTGGPDNFHATVALSSRPDGLQIGDFTSGQGPAAVAKQTLAVQYTGWVQSTGQQFDTSRQPGRQPFSFTLGAGQVIKGWDEGLIGVRAGGKRRLVIPSALGYGARAQPGIPANSTLVFDIQVLSINAAPSSSAG